MAKLVITKEDKEEFKSTINGKKKTIWMIVGMLIDFLATLSVSLLHIFEDKIGNQFLFLAILLILLVIVVLGGEMIGVYFGALEQYVYNKNNKKVLDVDE